MVESLFFTDDAKKGCLLPSSANAHCHTDDEPSPRVVQPLGHAMQFADSSSMVYAPFGHGTQYGVSSENVPAGHGKHDANASSGDATGNNAYSAAATGARKQNSTARETKELCIFFTWHLPCVPHGNIQTKVDRRVVAAGPCTSSRFIQNKASARRSLGS